MGPVNKIHVFLKMFKKLEILLVYIFFRRCKLKYTGKCSKLVNQHEFGMLNISPIVSLKILGGFGNFHV